MYWPLKIALAKLRPLNTALLVKITVVTSLMAAFLYGDYALFRRLFRAAAQIEALTPFFALGLLENLIGMVLLVALVVLFFSALTASIGSFFSDLDLEIYHSAPVSRGRLIASRWLKTMIQSSYLVVAFIAPIFVAFAKQYGLGIGFILLSTFHLVLLLVTPVTLAVCLILVLVRFFPVRRVHQITVILGIVMMTGVVIGFRVAQPERLFRQIDTDDLTRVLDTIRLPASEYLPSGWLAASLTSAAQQNVELWTVTVKLFLLAAVTTLLFFTLALRSYFTAYVRARESMAPAAIGAGGMTSTIDFLTRRLDPPLRALVRKEVRVLTRDVAQWSQLFMMAALLFIYLYNIRMMPLEGDVRAIGLAYLNLGMAGFVIAAICLRFAYPSVSAEGKAFWILQTSPMSYRRFLWVKVGVYFVPLLATSLALTVMANLILDAPRVVWYYTIAGSVLIALTLVSMGVGLGGMAPNFSSENPMEVGLSLGGLTYMATSMIYVGTVMFLMAHRVQTFFLGWVFGQQSAQRWYIAMAPVALSILLSVLLSVLPLEIARRQLGRRRIEG